MDAARDLSSVWWRRAQLAALAGAVGAAAGCTVGAGTGTLAGTLFVRDCSHQMGDYGSLAAPAAYNMNPHFFVADPVDDFPRPHPSNRVMVRVEPTGNRVEEADVFILQIANVHDVATALAQPVPLGPITNARAALVLNQTCPDAEVQMELDGTITFSHFGSASTAVPDDFRIEFQDRLTASFSVDVVDRRASTLGGAGGVPAAPALGGHLDGTFDFEVTRGRAAQSFP